MTNEQSQPSVEIVNAQGDIRRVLANIESDLMRVEALCAANKQELGKLEEAYRSKLAADQDEYRKSQEAYRSSQAAWKKNEENYIWMKLPCLIVLLGIISLVAYIAWRVS